MGNNNDSKATFMMAIEGLKEYAKVNANTVTKEDVFNYFKEMELDDAKFQMVSGYLMANGITISGEDSSDNEFLKLMEDAVAKESEEELIEEEKQVAKAIVDNMDLEEDNKYLQMYLKDLETISPLSDTTRAFLLMNIVEDKDKESLKLLSESYLEKIVAWIEPFRGKGVYACDLIQEANLAMMAYIGEERWLNNYEWKDKIKEGNTEDLMLVISGMDKAVKEEIEGSLNQMIDEQADVNLVSGKILSKVNLVNDWAVRLKEELDRKPTIEEVAKKMGVSEDIVREAIELSAETIEDISYEKSSDNKAKSK